MESRTFELAFSFDRADEADRRIAGVPAAARLVRRAADEGAVRVSLSVPGGKLSDATLADIVRISPATSVQVVGEDIGGALPAPRISAREVLLATAKASDGLVSRWLNRPVSRAISTLLLHIPAIRPIHATFGTMLLAAAMFASLVSGSAPGLVVGGLLFHLASVFDGVDGEIARATFRTSHRGALIDTATDMATNGLFILGVTMNLAGRTELAVPIGAWGLCLFVLGSGLITHRSARSGQPFSMDLVKHRSTAGASGTGFERLVRFLIIISSRDFFALACALLILVGVPMAVLVLFSASATVWILFVIATLVVPGSAR